MRVYKTEIDMMVLNVELEMNNDSKHLIENVALNAKMKILL